MIKSILKGKVTTSNEMGFSAIVTLFDNPNNLNITATYNGTSVNLTSETPVFDADSPVLWFCTDAQHSHSVAQANALNVEITCFNNVGEPSGSALYNSYFEVVQNIEESISPTYTNKQLSAILEAQSILVKNKLKSLAKKIGFK